MTSQAAISAHVPTYSNSQSQSGNSRVDNYASVNSSPIFETERPAGSSITLSSHCSYNYIYVFARNGEV